MVDHDRLGEFSRLHCSTCRDTTSIDFNLAFVIAEIVATAIIVRQVSLVVSPALLQLCADAQDILHGLVA